MRHVVFSFSVVMILTSLMLAANKTVQMKHSRTALMAVIHARTNARSPEVTRSQILSPALYVNGGATIDTLQAKGESVLAIVVRNNCSPCVHAIKTWRTWLVDRGKKPDLRVVTILRDAPQHDPLISGELTLCQWRCGSLLVRSPIEFTLLTGIQQAPTAVLIGPDQSVRVAVAGVPDQETLQAVLQVLERAPNASGHLLVRNVGEHSPLLDSGSGSPEIGAAPIYEESPGPREP